MAKDPSMPVVKRLSRYYRYLSELLDNDIVRISSRELSAKMGITASQIRQDLNCFGGFGQQGYGYNVAALRDEISKILGLDKSTKAVLIGAGNMGRAIASHMNFEKHGFRLVGIFDSKESMQGQLVHGLPIRNTSTLEEFFNENKPEVAILCIPKDSATEIADQLVSLGIKGFWNFSHCDLGVRYPDIPVENVHLSDSLMTFCYKIKAGLVE